MKKLFILVLVLLMGIMGTASASKSRFKDPNYSFSNIMNVYLAECTYAPRKAGSKIPTIILVTS